MDHHLGIYWHEPTGMHAKMLPYSESLWNVGSSICQAMYVFRKFLCLPGREILQTTLMDRSFGRTSCHISPPRLANPDL